MVLFRIRNSRRLGVKSTDDACLVRCLSLARARCQLLVAKTALTLWANVMLKHRDAVLARVEDLMSFESFMDLRNAESSARSELFPRVAESEVVGSRRFWLESESDS